MRLSLSRIVATLALCMLGARTAPAATYTWNLAGPSNNWNTTDANWTGAGTTWVNGSDAVFTGTGEAITFTEAISANSLTFNTAGFTFLPTGAQTVTRLTLVGAHTITVA